MTAIENIQFVRIMLDDSKDWYFPDILKALTESQMRIIRKYYTEQNERALRTLYTLDKYVENGDMLKVNRGAIGPIIFEGIAKVLYTRSVRVYKFTHDTLYSYTASYIDYNTYINQVYPRWDPYYSDPLAIKVKFPKEIHYTIKKSNEVINGVKTFTSRIIFNGLPIVDRADIWFIVKPEDFYVDTDNYLMNVNLSLPEEFHPEICALAAEILNDIDVNEQGRGEQVYQNQKLDMNKAVLSQ